MRGEKVTEVMITWKGHYTPAMESIKCRLVGIRKMNKEEIEDKEDQGLIRVKY